MADASLGSLTAKIGLDTASLRAGIGDAKQHFAKLKVDTDQAAGGIGSAFSKAGAVAAASVAAIGVAAAAFAIKSAGTFRDVGGEVLKLQRYTGGTAEEMSKLRFAAQQSGVDTDKLAKTMGFLSRNIAANKPEFDKFNIATVDAHGKALPLDQVLLNVAARFQQMPNGVEKTNLAMKLFGKTGADLIPMLNKGRDGLVALEAQAKKYGLVLTSANIEVVKKATAAQREQTAAMQGLQVQIGANVLPALTSLTKSFTDGLLAVMPVVSAVIRDAVVPAFTALAATVSAVTGFLTEHTVLAKGLAVVVGSVLVPAVLAWAAAQATAMATSIGAFLANGAAQALNLAKALGLVTVSAETGTLAMSGLGKAVGVALAAAVVGTTIVVSQLHQQESVAKTWAKKWIDSAGGVNASMETVNAAIGTLSKTSNSGWHLSIAGKMLYSSTTAKMAANQINGLVETYKELHAADAATATAGDQITDSFTRSGLAIADLGGATSLTKDQVEQLAASMGVDLAKASEADIAKLTDQATRLGYTSVAALKLADDQRTLGDWTKDVTAKTAAFADALQQVIGTKIDAAVAQRDYESALKAVSDVAVTDAKAEVDANRNVQNSIRALTSATEARTAAEETLQAVLHPTARTKEEAGLGLSDAKIALERSRLGVTRAQDALNKLRASGTATPDDLRSAELDLADAQNNVVHSTERLADAQQKVNDLTPAGIKNSQVYKDAASGLSKAQQDVADAQAANTKAVTDAKDVEKAHADRQKELAPLVEAVATATMHQAAQVYALTGSMTAAKIIIAGHIQDLRGVLTQAGLTTTQIDALVTQYGLIPGDVNTTIGVTDNATPVLDAIQQKIVDLAGRRHAANPNLFGPGYAAGGIIRQPIISRLAEEGPEVVLPLMRPARMRQLISEAGIQNLFGGPGPTGTPNPTGSTSTAPARQAGPLVHIEHINANGLTAGEAATVTAARLGWELTGRGDR